VSVLLLYHSCVLCVCRLLQSLLLAVVAAGEAVAAGEEAVAVVAGVGAEGSEDGAAGVAVVEGSGGDVGAGAGTESGNLTAVVHDSWLVLGHWVGRLWQYQLWLMQKAGCGFSKPPGKSLTVDGWCALFYVCFPTWHLSTPRCTPQQAMQDMQSQQ
jgi:hypothetical protein